MLQLGDVQKDRWERLCAAANAKVGETILDPALSQQTVNVDGVTALVTYDEPTATAAVTVTKTPFWNYMPPPLQAEDRIREWSEHVQ